MKCENLERESNRVFKAGAWYTICTVFLKALAFITMPIFTRIMTKADIGQFSVLTSWISILSVVVTLGLSNSVSLAKYDFKGKIDAYISSIVVLGAMVVIILYIFIFPIRFKITEFIGVPIYALHIMMVYLLLSPSREILLSKYRVELQYSPVIFLTLISSVLSIGTSVFLVNVWKDGFLGRTIGMYVPLIIIDGSIMLILLIKGRCISLDYWKYALTICIPLVIHHLAGNIMHTSDRVMIQRFCGSEAVALYSIAYSIAIMVNIVRNALESAWEPWVFDLLSKGRGEEIRKYSYLYVGFFAVLCIGIVMLAPELLYIIGGDSYAEAVYVVPAVVLGYMCSMIYSLYGGIERYYKQQKVFALYGAVCATVNLVLNYLFIPIFGYLAAAITTLVSCLLEMVLHYKNCRKIGYANLYNTKYNTFVLLATFLACALIMPIYKYSIIRYILIGSVGIVGMHLLVKYKVFIKQYIQIIRRKGR